MDMVCISLSFKAVNTPLWPALLCPLLISFFQSAFSVQTCFVSKNNLRVGSPWPGAGQLPQGGEGKKKTHTNAHTKNTTKQKRRGKTCHLIGVRATNSIHIDTNNFNVLLKSPNIELIHAMHNFLWTIRFFSILGEAMVSNGCPASEIFRTSKVQIWLLSG